MAKPSTPTAPPARKRKPGKTAKKAAPKKATAARVRKPPPRSRKEPPRGRRNRPPADDPWCGLNLEQVEICEAWLADRERNQSAAWLLHFAKDSTPNTVNACASRFFNSKPARAYLAKRRVEIAQHLALTPEKVLEELAAIGFHDPGEIIEWGPHGITVKDSRFLPRHARAAVKSVKRTEGPHGASMHITFADKREALDLLGRALDLWRGGEGDTGPGLIVVMPP